MRLIAREDFIEFSRSESYRSYISHFLHLSFLSTGIFFPSLVLLGAVCIEEFSLAQA
jgi:hypothetical protein